MRHPLSVRFPLDKFGHDLRQSLRAILFNTQRIQRQNPPLSPETLTLLEQVIAAARRQEELIEGVVDYDSAISQAGQLDRRMRLSVVLQAACRQVEPFRKLHQGTLQVSECPLVYASPILAKALEHLLHNALKFHRLGSEPLVRVEVEVGEDVARGIVIRVTDDGIGIEEKYRESVFSPLTRLHGPDEYAGPGMGLSICRALLGSIQGTVIFEDSGGGSGVCAAIRVPAAEVDRLTASD